MAADGIGRVAARASVRPAAQRAAKQERPRGPEGRKTTAARAPRRRDAAPERSKQSLDDRQDGRDLWDILLEVALDAHLKRH